VRSVGSSSATASIRGRPPFLAPLDAAEASQLTAMLQRLLVHNAVPPPQD
jgi:hypothetical protein